MIKPQSRILSNSAALIIHTMLAAVFALAQIKILTSYLPQQEFGLFASMRGFGLLVALVSAVGLPQLLLRFIPDHEAMGQSRAALRLSISAVAMSIGLFALCALATVVFDDHLLAFLAGHGVSPSIFPWFLTYVLSITLKLVIYGGLNGLRRHTVQVVLESVSLFIILSALP